MSPGDVSLRDEYKKLMDLKDKKHKEWFSKMNGFLHSDKMKEIEENEQKEKVLKEKMFKKYQVGVSRREQ